LDLLEFQAKELLQRFDIAIPKGRMASDAEAAGRYAARLGCERFVVKAQVQAGERREAGGIRFAASPDGVRATAELLLGKDLLTKQMGGRAQTVRWLIVEEALATTQLLYAAVALDRDNGALSLLVSRAGGEGIEERIAAEPGLIARTPLRIEVNQAVGDFEAAARSIELDPAHIPAAASVFKNLARLAVELDAPQVEINPLALLPDGSLTALDAKITIDDNALFRHPALAELRAAFETETGDPEELSADQHQVNYVALDGNVGMIANGAGLALATLDLIAAAGGRAANFMDVRTTAASLDIAFGASLVLSNPRVRAVIVNVHGGGMQRCDTIAEGLAVAINKSTRKVPIVARLAGNNAEFARVRLQAAGVAVDFADDMAEAAFKAMKAAAGNG